MSRSFADFSSEFLARLPSKEELASYSDEELKLLNNYSNILDNLRYFERKRRDELAQAAAVQS